MPPEEAAAEEMPALTTPPEVVSVEDTLLSKEESQAARHAHHRAVADAAKRFLLEQAAVSRQPSGLAARRRAAPPRGKNSPFRRGTSGSAGGTPGTPTSQDRTPSCAPCSEKKLVGLHDAHEMLQVMNTELALQRAQRLHGSEGSSRQALRVLTGRRAFRAINRSFGRDVPGYKIALLAQASAGTGQTAGESEVRQPPAESCLTPATRVPGPSAPAVPIIL